MGSDDKGARRVGCRRPEIQVPPVWVCICARRNGAGWSFTWSVFVSGPRYQILAGGHFRSSAEDWLAVGQIRHFEHRVGQFGAMTNNRGASLTDLGRSLPSWWRCTQNPGTCVRLHSDREDPWRSRRLQSPPWSCDALGRCLIRTTGLGVNHTDQGNIEHKSAICLDTGCGIHGVAHGQQHPNPTGAEPSRGAGYSRQIQPIGPVS